MSDQLPRKRIEPLAPPPGQFDRVMSEARYRRHRRAMAMLTVAFVFVAGLGGGLALGEDTQRSLYAALNGQGNDSKESATPSSTSTASKNSKVATAKVTDKATKEALPATSAATKLSNPSRGKLAYRGRAVGPAGQPAAGLYVYVGAPDEMGFVPSGDFIGVTAEDGTFSMSCPKAPVLLAPWPINAEAKAKARDVDWGATFVGGASQALLASDVPCTRKAGKVDETTVLRGAAVEGVVSMPSGCRDAQLGLWLWLGNDRAFHVNVQALEHGDPYRVSGLPAGEHTVGANGERYRVRVGATGTVNQDVLFACDQDDESSPTETAEPMPTDTSTVVPTLPTGTATGTASSTSSATSSSTATADPGATKTP